MRAISGLGLLLLAGCTSAMQRESYGVPGARYEIVRINGTFERVVFVVDRDMVWTPEQEPAPCGSGDPTRTDEVHQAPEPVPAGETPSAASMSSDCR